MTKECLLEMPDTFQEEGVVLITQPISPYSILSIKENLSNCLKFKIPPIRSPLRYPGGKTRALKQIIPVMPSFKEFREPFVGGASIFFALKQIHPSKKFWINDSNQELYHFWGHCKNKVDNLVKEIMLLRKVHNRSGKKLFLEMLDQKTCNLNEFQRAVRFFILNRITFSGLSESGGYSEESFRKRFTISSIERLRKASKSLKDTKITNLDYEKVIRVQGDDVFIFLDPPYLTKAKSKLYGKNGNLHEMFDHERFAENMKRCKHKWLITYEDSPEVRKLFSFAHIYEWELQYGMNNYMQKNAAVGKELFISNYKIDVLENQKVR